MSCRLLVEPERLTAGDIEITGSDHHYLFRVRRLTTGDAVLLFDGDGHEAEAKVASIAAERATLLVGEPYAAATSTGPEYRVLLPLIKGERMDHCIRQLVELGVDAIHPIITEHTVVTLDEKRAESRHARFQRIAEAAARQCRRADVADVTPICRFADAITAPPVEQADCKLLFWERAAETPLRGQLPARPPERVIIAVGPEGGFAASEIDLAANAGFKLCGLGPRILRAETAPVAALAILRFALEQSDAVGDR